MKSSGVLLLFVGIIVCAGSLENNVFSLPVIYDLGTLAPQVRSTFLLAMNDINNDPNILPNITLELDMRFLFGPARSVGVVLEMDGKNQTLAIGGLFETNVDQIATTGAIYDIAFHSPVVSTENLSDKMRFPYFSRTCTAGSRHVHALYAALHHFSDESGPGWTNLAMVCTSEIYGINFAELMIELAPDPFVIVAYQQFINDYMSAPNFDIELNEVERSGARVIAFFGFYEAYSVFIKDADAKGLVNEHYVYVNTDGLGCAGLQDIDEETENLSRGMLGTCQDVQPFGITVTNEQTLQWQRLDPMVYPGAGPGTYPGGFDYLVYDSVWVAARAIHKLDKRNLLDQDRIPAELWQETVKEVSFEGVSGNIVFDDNGDRNSPVTLRYFSVEKGVFVQFGVWDEEHDIKITEEVIWFSGTNEIPDLDIRDAFDYWSCHDKEKRTDKTGKTVTLHTPNGSNVDEISSHYHCDHFIDCANLSDESVDCSQNYTIVFIVFGIVTGVLIVLSICLLVFVVLFGIILKYQTLRAVSPIFLVVMLISIIIGYSSIYAWFGKPHPVACAFQPWLLGLPTVSVIVALCVKTFRVWRIFASEFTKRTISDLKLFGCWALAMVPAVVIVVLWTIISTPTASIEHRGGEDHYVCSTGGFTGEPGGYVFFGLFVAYAAMVLLVGVFLSIATRKVPSLFNESKLLVISIYNLGFLGAIVIPVFLVVQPFNPFIAWILRTSAILYAYSSIVVLQFAPSVFRIIVIDKFRKVDVHFNTTKFSKGSSSSLNSPLSARSGNRTN